MDACMHPDDQALACLRTEHPGWRIWRSIRGDGRLGEWVATLHDPNAGVDPTVMESSSARLQATLVREAERARGRER